MSFSVRLDALKLVICLGDTSRRAEAHGGTTNAHLIGRRDWYFDRKRGRK